MADASSSVPQRRASDAKAGARFRAWWATNGVQVVVFVLLGVIVAGEVSDYVNDRAEAERDATASCHLGNLIESNAESLRRLRLQAPVITAAGDLFTATSPEERRAVEAELREALGDREVVVAPEELPSPEDCE